MADDEENTFCSSCGKQSATNYLCNAGTGKSVDLCNDCLRTEESFAAELANEAKSARCRYCGGAPCAGGIDSLSQILGEPTRHRWMCMPCSTEYYSFFKDGLRKIPKDLKTEEQMISLKEVATDTENHMKAFIQRRDN